MKYVPKECCVGKERQKIYQYTLIDECTRERFLYAFEEKNSYTTLLFLKRALLYFGYLPEMTMELSSSYIGRVILHIWCSVFAIHLGLNTKPYAHTPQGTTGRSKDYTETTPSDSTANCLSTTLMISTIRWNSIWNDPTASLQSHFNGFHPFRKGMRWTRKNTTWSASSIYFDYRISLTYFFFSFLVSHHLQPNNNIDHPYKKPHLD